MSFSSYVQYKKYTEEIAPPADFGGRYTGVNQAGAVAPRLNRATAAIGARSHMTPAQIGGAIMELLASIPWNSQQQPITILGKVMQDIRHGALDQQQQQPVAPTAPPMPAQQPQPQPQVQSPGV